MIVGDHAVCEEIFGGIEQGALKHLLLFKIQVFIGSFDLDDIVTVLVGLDRFLKEEIELDSVLQSFHLAPMKKGRHSPQQRE